jgi:hypothetical protein
MAKSTRRLLYPHSLSYLFFYSQEVKGEWWSRKSESRRTGQDRTGPTMNNGRRTISKVERQRIQHTGERYLPRDDLVEIVVEGNASSTIYDTAARIVNKVLRNHRQVGVSKDSLETSLRSLLQGGLEVFARNSLFRPDSQVHQGNVSGRDTHCHSGQLSIEGRDNLSYGLGGSGRSRNQVGQCGTSRTPILATLGGSINDQLVRGCCRTKRNSSKRKNRIMVSHSACSTKSVDD